MTLRALAVAGGSLVVMALAAADVVTGDSC